MTLRNMKIKYKLMLFCTLLTVVPIVLVGNYSYIQSRSLLREQAFKSLDISVKKVEYNVDMAMIRMYDVFDAIVYGSQASKVLNAYYPDKLRLKDTLEEFIDPYFNSVLGVYRDVEAITIYTSNDIPAYGQFVLPINRIIEEPWYDKALEGTEIYWYYDKDELIASQRIIDVLMHDRVNILSMKINTDSFFQYFKLADKQDYGLLIADSSGNVIHTNNDYIKRADFDNIINSEESDIITLGKLNYLIKKGNISKLDWTFYCLISMDSITVNTEKILITTLLVALTCAAIMLMASLLFSNALSRSLQTLIRTIDVVEQGNLKIELKSDSKDEIGELTNRFGRMIKRINTLIEENYQSKITQKEAELKALQAQINPHFLYNSLSMINWKALSYDANDISDVVVALSNFYRTTLNRGENIISVKDELENIRAYVDIQLFMHNQSFDVKYDIDESVYDYSMIKLVLQPIVENAIEHGIDYISQRRGLLTISAKDMGNCLKFAVHDNGAGMEKEMSQQILENESNGYGIRNVNERLKLFFGAEYGIKVFSEKGRGTLVTLVIPKLKK